LEVESKKHKSNAESTAEVKETNIGGKYAGIGMVLTKVDDKEVDSKPLEDIGVSHKMRFCV
jgi:hypothetical protein